MDRFKLFSTGGRKAGLTRSTSARDLWDAIGGHRESLLRRFLDDLPKLESYLKLYDEAKQKNKLDPDDKDIGQIKSIQDLFTAIEPYKKERDAEEKKNKGNYFKYVDMKLESGEDFDYEKLDNAVLFQPRNQKAASILGLNTQWCTTYGKYCTNPDWKDRTSAIGSGGYNVDYLYILVDKKDPDRKWQLYMGKFELRDENDRDYSNDIRFFILEYPGFFKWMQQYDIISVAPFAYFDDDGDCIIAKSNIPNGDWGEFLSEYCMTTHPGPALKINPRHIIDGEYDKFNNIADRPTIECRKHVISTLGYYWGSPELRKFAEKIDDNDEENTLDLDNLNEITIAPRKIEYLKIIQRSSTWQDKMEIMTINLSSCVS